MKKVCRICQYNHIIEPKDFKGYLYCQNCNCLWIKQRPITTYEESYYKGTSSKASNLFKPVANFFYHLRTRYTKTKSTKIWIDVGAGEGGYLLSINSQKRIGVEISKTGREIMSSSGIQAISNKQFLNTKKKFNADIISFWHVLEHVENPWAYLKLAKKNLAKNGKIVIGIPNIDSYEFKYFTRKWFHFAPQFHLWHYSTKSMSILLRNNGFKISSIDYWAPEHHLTGLIQSFLNKTSDAQNILHLLVKRGTDPTAISFKTTFWIAFWLTLGLPFIFILWIIQSLLKKSGAIVIVATLKI